MKKIMFLMVFVTLLVASMASYTAAQNCVCASCNRPCGSGHETWCQYAPKADTSMTEGNLVVAEINCVCAECGKKCGTGHETWCSSYQKPKADTPIINDLAAGDTNIVVGDNCIEKGLQCTLNGTPCCAPYECKGKFPNTYCQ
jgi:hypothetical protein